MKNIFAFAVVFSALPFGASAQADSTTSCLPFEKPISISAAHAQLSSLLITKGAQPSDSKWEDQGDSSDDGDVLPWPIQIGRTGPHSKIGVRVPIGPSEDTAPSAANDLQTILVETHLDVVRSTDPTEGGKKSLSFYRQGPEFSVELHATPDCSLGVANCSTFGVTGSIILHRNGFTSRNDLPIQYPETGERTASAPCARGLSIGLGEGEGTANGAQIQLHFASDGHRWVDLAPRAGESGFEAGGLASQRNQKALTQGLEQYFEHYGPLGPGFSWGAY